MDFEPDCYRLLYKSQMSWPQVQAQIMCLQRVRNVDYLLIAMLVAVATLGNPPRLGEHNLFCWLQVVLLEDHDFCCNKQEAMSLNDVRSGNKVVFRSRVRKTLVATCEHVLDSGLEQIESENELPPRKVTFFGLPSIWCFMGK
jgi:hypothetical protein